MSNTEWQQRLAPVVRTQQIVVSAMVTGCVLFLVIALLVARGMAPGGGTPLVSYLAMGFALMTVMARIAVPRIVVAAGRQEILRTQGDDAARAGTFDRPGIVGRLLQMFSTATIVSCALLEGATFFLLVAYLVEGWRPAVILAVLLIVVLALHIPTQSRVVHWIEDQLALLEQEQRPGR